MSEANEPRNKRQKRDGGGTPRSVVLGGPMYDEETARKMLRNAHVWPLGSWGEGKSGFDPDDEAVDNVYHHSVENELWDEITPMIYFAMRGDLKMCRYLISRGASTTKGAGIIQSPMDRAMFSGRLDICKLLYANGAQDHVRLTDNFRWTPFLRAAVELEETMYYDLTKWLVLHGALCSDNNSDEVVGDLIHHQWLRQFDSEVYVTCRRLVDWSKDVLQAHSSMVTFLLGTLSTPEKDRGCILQCLSGHPGIRKNIADFGLEVIKAKQLRILRSVVEVLPETMRIGRKN